MLGPAIAAISLGLVGPLAIGERLGRNARFASLGNGVAAAVMGTCGYLLSSRSVFLVTFVLAIPTLLALSRIREREIDAARAHGAVAREVADANATSVLQSGAPAPAADLRRQRVAAAARQCRDAAADGGRRHDPVEPMGAGADRGLHRRAAGHRGAGASPSVGRKAQQWGRRPLLLIGFAALAIRGLLFAIVSDPYLLVAVQVFDGVTAAVFSVMIPLIVADVAFGSGHFNLAQGIVGTATGIGASLSTVLAGYVSDKFGSSVAFTGLAGVAALGLAMIWLVMPETRRVR